MRKFVALLGGLIALVMLLAPAVAQDQTVVDIAAGNDDFSTLVAAVQAAGLVETLSGAGPFTVFAPTNEAFEAALEALDLTAEELLANTDALTAILTYHVVAGRLTAGDLQAGATALSGEAITVEGTVVNGSANLTAFNLQASNGIVHVLDAVLIPPSFVPANVRVGHFSPDAPAVDVFVNGDLVVAGLAYPGVSDFLELLPGTYSVAVAPAGSPVEEAVIGPLDVSITGGAFLTIAAVGTVEAGTLTAQVLDESFYNASLGDGSAAINFFHALDGADAVNVERDLITVVSQLAYPGVQGINDGAFAITDFAAGTYRFDFVQGGIALATEENVPIVAGVRYLIALIGTTPEDASIFIEASGLIPTVVDVLDANRDFSTLVTIIDATGLTDTLNDLGPFTVLAPTNEAFEAALEALGISAVEALTNPGLLTDILTYHVIPGDFTVAELEAAGIVTSVLGENINFSGGLINGSATIEGRNFDAANGTVHFIDSVLIPGTAASAPGGSVVSVLADNDSTSTLVAAIEAAGLVGALSGDGPFTVLAPTNEAFEAALEALGLTAEDLLSDTELLASVLQYHVLPGDFSVSALEEAASITTLQGENVNISDGVINGFATIEGRNFSATNGTIHYIDSVLLPGTAASAPVGSVVSVLAANDDTSLLVQAIEAAGLVGALSGDGPFTILAPTNAAFEAALASFGLSADALLSNTDLLAAVLQYHVVPGNLSVSDLEAAGSNATLMGQSVTVEGGVVNGTATIEGRNFGATNGTIHYIDSVLVPEL